MSNLAEESQYTTILCKNYGKLGVEHWIIPSPNHKSYNLEKHGICGVCSSLGFQDNKAPSDHITVRRKKPYRDSKINNKAFLQASPDNL